MFRIITLACVAVLVSACSVHTTSVRPTSESQKVIFGPGVTNNHSPSTVGLVCTGRDISSTNYKHVRVAVGEFDDLTGKFSNDDAGYKVTQGAQHMATTALGKLDSKKIVILEREDVGIFNFELGLATNRLLGGGKGTKYQLPDGSVVPYKPTTAGAVIGSDYYITGAITELNYNIRSGGFDPEISNIGAGKRVYAMNVAIDMRLVETKTLRVVETITLQKQMVGYEWKANIFRFFNSELFDINTGQKVDEPVQLGVRTVMEQGVAMLMGYLYNIDAQQAFRNIEDDFDKDWIRNPVKVADELCPVVTPVVKKVVAEKKPRKIYNPGACTNIVDECEFCNLRKIAQKPLSSQPAGYYAQVAAHNDKKDAFNEWSCLEKNYAPLVNDQDYVVKRNAVGLYALQIGPYKTFNEANTFCSDAKSKNLDCYVERVD